MPVTRRFRKLPAAASTDIARIRFARLKRGGDLVCRRRNRPGPAAAAAAATAQQARGTTSAMDPHDELVELLVDGARYGDLEDVDAALAQHVSVDSKDSTGRTGELESMQGRHMGGAWAALSAHGLHTGGARAGHTQAQQGGIHPPGPGQRLDARGAEIAQTHVVVAPRRIHKAGEWGMEGAWSGPTAGAASHSLPSSDDLAMWASCECPPNVPNASHVFDSEQASSNVNKLLTRSHVPCTG
eukprot:238029-Chlamydomonas_euryale.AAC.12